VDLNGVDLRDADLTGSQWAEDAVVPEGWERDASSGRLRAVGDGPETAEAN